MSTAARLAAVLEELGRIAPPATLAAVALAVLDALRPLTLSSR